MAQEFFPSARNPRQRGSGAEVILRQLGWWNWVRTAQGKGPKWSPMRELQNTVFYLSQEKRGGYLDVREEARKYLKSVGDYNGIRSMDNYDDSGKALRELKEALRFDRQKQIEKSIENFVSAGGTAQGIKSSLKKMMPLNFVSKKHMPGFIEYLGPDGQERMDMAIEHWAETLMFSPTDTEKPSSDESIEERMQNR